MIVRTSLTQINSFQTVFNKCSKRNSLNLLLLVSKLSLIFWNDSSFLFGFGMVVSHMLDIMIQFLNNFFHRFLSTSF
jgi:hypothetical protein